jgi:1-acyl-sn-glycerol-3-phosphate acyltransferase
LIYPEGTTSNGKQCFLFKKGAFLAEKKIRPFVLQYGTDGSVSPAWDIIDFLPFAIIHLCWGGYTCNLLELSDFEPNEYLFKTHADKGKERWEIYAWAVREIIIE